MSQNKKENKIGCYDPNCNNKECKRPAHYDYICLNTACHNSRCQVIEHYNRTLLNYGSKEETEKIRQNEHEHHEHNGRMCSCGDCEDKEELLNTETSLLKNKSVQIILSSTVLFILGYTLEYLQQSTILTTSLFIIVVLISGYDVILGGVKQLFNKRITMGFLMGLAVVCSLIIGHPEEAAAVTLLFFLAEFLEDYAEERAQNSIKSLIELAPETATIKIDDKVDTVKIDQVKINDIVIIKPGDKIPLDGKIIKGNSTINQAPITGESTPINKGVDNEVYAGTINQDGYLEIKVTKEAKDSIISKIIQLVENSKLKQSPTEKFIDKFAGYYTPIIISIAVLVAIIPPLFFQQPWMDWIYRALVMMVVSCPCAFVISTPVSMVTAITSATRKGVLIKGRDYIEGIKDVKAVIFDKTGTLTEGKLKVIGIKTLTSEYNENELLEIAGSLESQSNHPIAQAIKEHSIKNNINLKEVFNFKNISSKGVVGFLKDKQYYVSNQVLINPDKVQKPETVNKYQNKSQITLLIGDHEKILGLIMLKDTIREKSKDTISKLNDMGLETVMLTGDNDVVANEVSKELNIKHTYANLLPEDKLSLLNEIKKEYGNVAMIGDGVNDAPALAQANIGIAMGTIGSDVAIETADIALMQDDLSKIPYLFRLSKKTMGVVKQNVYTAISIKTIFALLAVFGFITLWAAVGIGDMGLTLLVILNSFRIGSEII
ncbi:MAG: cation-translocating P-type ATPase [Methanobacteriaceae archaeon]|nr:cation-translocating P-type ATPase [Methanobacteriaceae archaeon]